MDNLNAVIVGVGGQGTLLASRVLGRVALNLKKDVKVSEVHGMSQRGGSVTTYVRIGEKVYSPVVEQRSADYILAFEELEALRAAPYLKENGEIIVNTQKIAPLSVTTGAQEYPKTLETLKENADVTAIDALTLARQAGNERAVNTVLLGAFAKKLEIDEDIWREAIRECVPEKYLKANEKAFDLGYAS
ncbi:MAG: indolepyruvate oxidoreductase subunit beta [Clostridiales bacterium]|jgi:indolepyruvate ferredoxin oxidoreductase beta subunit|nr:indolepyruvate oxidoreductase subunit beta [Clostridiales bacterium]